MGARLSEVLMALGDWAFDLDWDPGLWADVLASSHVLLYEGEKLAYGGVLLDRTPAREGIAIGGPGPLYHLGLDKDRGPTILDREYLACTDKLSNGAFELEDLYWKTAEGTKWAVREVDGEPRAGVWAAKVTSDPAKDDVLVSEEPFPAAVGQQFIAAVWVKRPSGAVGKIRLRTVYEGRYDPANLLTNGNFESGPGVGWTVADDFSVVTDGAMARSGTKVLRCGPTTKLQWIENPSFEDDLDHWSGSADWTVVSGNTVSGVPQFRTGTKGLKLDGPFAGRRVMSYDPDTGVPAVNPITPVTSGERYRYEGFVKTLADPIDELPGIGVVYFVMLQTNADDPDERVYIEGPRFDPHNATDEDWRASTLEFDIGEGKTHLVPMIYGFDVVQGFWCFDDITLTRIKGNRARQPHSSVSVTPERTYQLLGTVRSDLTCTEGRVRFVVKYSAVNRVDVYAESGWMERTDDEWKLLDMSVTPPSGYDTATVYVEQEDIVGGRFWVDDVALTDQDRSTVVTDVVSAATGTSYVELSSQTTAPEGTERVRVEVVAEADAGGWVVDDVSIARVGTPAITGEIVEALLKHPETDNDLLLPGTIIGTDTILYDWRIRYLIARDALLHLSRAGVCSPVREYRVRLNADGDPVLDWGTADEIFAERNLLYAGEDLVFPEAPTVRRSWHERLARVLVVGAERQLPDGRRVLITGEASNGDGEALDWFGEPVSFTRIIEDSTVDHVAYANARAREEADKVAEQREAIRLQLADWRVLDDFDVGDWIQAYKPEAGLEDLSNPMDDAAGRTVFPKTVRVLSRDRQLGPGFRLELRRNDGALIDVTDRVHWEQANSAQVELGDLLPEFVVDSQGPAAGVQFRRFRASMPTR